MKFRLVHQQTPTAHKVQFASSSRRQAGGLAGSIVISIASMFVA